ncbi:MAG TPA: PAS domain S-box protein, partial [Methanomassiliicoccales archaeon]|nr:PAS domain S-box protein [Methanomassiliicoccales archaeon]
MRDIILLSQDTRFQLASKAYLEQNGDFNVILETDVDKVLEILNWTDLDAIVCEHGDNIDSLALVTTLRENELDLPFILVHDPHLGEEMLPRGLEAGADYVFRKAPIPGMNSRPLLCMLEIAIESHMQLHTALALSEHYRRVVENVEVLIIMIDRLDRIRFINRNCLELTGFMWDEVLGRAAIGRLFPAQSSDGKDVKVLLHQKMAEPGDTMEVLELMGKDGSLHMVSWRHTVSEDAEGQFLLSVGIPTAMVLRDLPEQHPYQLLDRINEAFYVLDRDLRLRYINSEAERTLRKRREDVLGKHVTEALPAIIGSEYHQRLLQAVQDKQPVRFETMFGKGENANWYDVRIHPQNGKFNIFFSLTTERKKAEAALLESESRYRDILEQAFEGILVVDEKGEVQYLNQRFSDILGYPIEALRGQNMTRFLSQDDQGHFLRCFRDDNPMGAGSFEYSYVQPSGMRFLLDVMVTPRKGADGHPNGFTILLHDVTQSRRDREKLHLQSRVLDQMRDAVAVIGKDHRVRYWNGFA